MYHPPAIVTRHVVIYGDWEGLLHCIRATLPFRQSPSATTDTSFVPKILSPFVGQMPVQRPFLSA